MGNNNPTILFDGICNLCNGAVRFIIKRDKKKQFCFVTLQSKEGGKLIENYKIPKETDSVILVQNNKIYKESEAALEIAKLLPFPWKWAIAFKIIPKNWRDRVYRRVARNRYKWFGKRKTVCHFDPSVDREKSLAKSSSEADSSLRSE